MNTLKLLSLMLLISILVTACAPSGEPTTAAPTEQGTYTQKENDHMELTQIDPKYNKRDGVEVIYLAGGCFWGIEKLMQSIPGVVNAVSGYANGDAGEVPTYQTVVSGKTGYRETVRVEYKPDKVSLDALLFAYFQVIDPTIKNAQGNDRGTQYQTGIYYADEVSEETVKGIVEVVKKRYEDFVVEIEPLERFYDAEEYHQNYLDKVPGGYCHISTIDMDTISDMIIDPGKYPRPSDEKVREMLTEEQYQITQQNGTEMAFQNEYWDNHARGIYVDVVTGEPLFSSSDKYDSGTGWPSFSKGIDENAFFLVDDTTYGMLRTSVNSRAGDTHLGHVFYNDPTSPSGTRYCINSAALRFVPYEEMESLGYGYLKKYVN